MRRNELFHEVTKNRVLFLMLIPSVVFFLVFSYLPMSGIYLAFTRFDLSKGIFYSPFVGFDNFRYLVKTGQLFLITRNTILYNLVFIFVGNVTQIAAAIFISEISGKYFKKVSQSVMFLPYFISYVLISVFVYQFFNYEHGIISTILKFLGMEPFDFSSSVGAWKYIIIFFYVWKNIGYGMVIYLAAITNISSEYYEAAEIDGADVFKQIRYITLPMIKPIFMILFLFSIGKILKGQFDLFYQITGNNGMLFDATQIIDTYVFRSLVNHVDYGRVAAAGLYQSFFGLLFVVVINFIVKRFNEEYAIF